MTPNYEDSPVRPPKKTGIPGWGWALIGCAIILPLIIVVFGAAILFPVFAQAREKARQTSCMSNCKQLGMALMMYVQDHDETFPPKKAEWTVLLQKYQNKPETYKCPSNTTSPYGYAMNQELLGKKWASLEEPDAIESLFDSNVSGPNALAAPEAIAYRHKGSGNVAFADGRVKSIKNPTSN